MSFIFMCININVVFSKILQCLFMQGSVMYMRLHRFYVTQPLGEEVVIDNVSLIKQWAKVFRYKKGDFVILFNGEALDVTFSINVISNKICTFTRNGSVISYIPKKKIVLYLCIIKKDNFDLVVQKVTELGVSLIVPVISERSEKKDINFDRLLRIITEASEQCGRGDIPTLAPVISLVSAVEDGLSNDASFVLQMDGEDIFTTTIQKEIATRNSFSFFVGPEGGWTDTEMKLFKEKGIIGVSLGKTTLRAETAAIVGTAFLSK